MTRDKALTRIEQELAESCRVKQQFSGELKAQIADLAGRIAKALSAGKTLYWMGNGGSAADAQHLACELVGRLRRPCKAFAAMATSTRADEPLRASSNKIIGTAS